MKNINWKQAYAIKEKHKKFIKTMCPNVKDVPGIYALVRTDENGINYNYSGQSLKVWTRLAEHCMGYQHIDQSIRTHKWFSKDTPHGWKIDKWFTCLESQLNAKERETVLDYALRGYQMRNKDTGGGKGKSELGERKQPKTYTEGKQFGYDKANKEMAILFTKYLKADVLNDNKLCQRKLKEFNETIRGIK